MFSELPIPFSLLPGLQVPLQRLLRELPDVQLALLAGHHDAGPAEAHGHFHPGPRRPGWAGPNRCLGRRAWAGTETPGRPSGPGARSRAPWPWAGGNRRGGGSGEGDPPGGGGPGTPQFRAPALAAAVAHGAAVGRKLRCAPRSGLPPTFSFSTLFNIIRKILLKRTGS